ncbi:MAG TPA: cadherin domain-containing protein, partial [Vicinamibacterales bacterium]
ADNISATNPTGAITGPVSYFWQADLGKGFQDITVFAAGEVARIEGLTFTVTEDLAGVPLRVRAVYIDGHGVLEQVFSDATAPVEVNVAPVITSGAGAATAAFSTPENSTAVTTVTATDANAGDVVTFTVVGGADAAKFKIDSATGALSFLSAPDFEAPGSAANSNVYNVIVQASDGLLVDTQQIAVTVTNVNDLAPVMTSAGTVSVPENSTVATTVTASDLDGLTTTFTFSIVGGADAAKFTINPASGVLSFVTPPDFEVPTDAGANNVYNVMVQASDGLLSPVQSIAVSVTDVIGITVTSNAAIINGTSEPDSLTGGAGNNRLNGLGGNDTLSGLGGNDILDGGTGADVMTGGLGNDTYIVDNVGDVVIEAAGAGTGTDTIQTTLNTFSLVSLPNVENLTFTGTGNFIGTGNAAINVVTGGAGDDILSGAGGDDTLTGNAGNDTLNGDAGNDTLNGNAGNDILDGGIGNDVLNGGADNDTLNGGAGNDTLAGGAGVDTASYVGETDGMFVDLITGTARRGSAAAIVEDTLTAIENVTGGSGNDTISGNNAANRLDGGNGNDTLVGLGGADILIGGLGNDIFTYNFGDGADAVDGGADQDTLNIVGTAAANTLDVIFNGTSITQFEGGTLTGVEAITADLQGGTDVLTYAGTAANVTVNLATNTASGFTSIASIENVTGGTGNDTFTGNASNNTFDGGAGTDRAVFAGAAAVHSFALNGTSLNVTGDATVGTDT